MGIATQARVFAEQIASFPETRIKKENGMAEGKAEVFEVWAVGKKHFRHGNEILELPAGWVVVPSGDSGLTRRIKGTDAFWVILGRFKNRVTSQGVCAPEEVVNRLRADLEAERSAPGYQKKLESGRKYRAAKQDAYAEDFEAHVYRFLGFSSRWEAEAHALARAVSEHAVPVGSGTVARTQRIPIEARAEAAVIAWMRHQTTSYDRMHIERVAGERREVRRKLAEISRTVLDRYRTGEDVDFETCPLAKAMGWKQTTPCKD